ncbi:GNAT family N-acetyltransferase [Nodosilinea nodulosa]|uniref:GNAT family N-acetyltransferase n=1 Tax=Nodosilinea nodulosa TaxID=416001 RepID=UPI00037F06C6|nr:GNAT family N-acetyltransferase [Nodosilinea nodulosa]
MTKADIPNVKAFVSQTFGDEEDFYLSYYPVVSHIPVVIAEHQEKLIGAASVYHNSLHPYWVETTVAVAEPYRRQGLGRKLHEAALKARPLEDNHLGIKGCYYQGNDDAEAFLLGMGYQLKLDCHCIELNIENFDLISYLAIPSQIASDCLSIASFTDLFLIPTKQQEVFDFLVSRYSEEHCWSPPQPKDHPEWQKIVFDGVLPELSFALLADGQVVGAVTAGITNNGTLDISWGYISRHYSTDEAVSLLKCLFAHQFKAARDRGLYKADMEIDTTDGVSSSLLNWLPICDDKVWRILQKPRTPSNNSGAAD